MKHYKMATISSPSIIKQPLRALEIPLNKFSEEVIPHHQKIYEQHKQHITKLMAVNNAEQLSKELSEKKRVVKQLRDLLYELDTLRTQVEDNDLDGFDSKTMQLRTSILKLTKCYQDLEKAAEKIIHKDDISPEEDPPNERINPFIGTAQIQIEGDLQQLKLKQEYDRLHKVQEIQKDTEILQEMYRSLHGITQEQGDQVSQVESNVAISELNINEGYKDIVKANKLNAIAYPATGAFVGTLLAGPIGFLAGLKVGGVAAIGCAFAGYAGGKFLKKHIDEVSPSEAEHVINNENNENHTVVSETDKKDI
ncbi:hypothetical protein GWI33_001629 [Rhynchophorus ferrugineus]|uniref:t-SNARE coiled-coil homology domain-containing protein n=1 Tax=Rhynchophorus ferrugineus TaxID=354439 RepID=A0A834INP5_RHYFE|nr:hypothetical protein GWI33_001629 [Rhynchophorus ferrugineus]